MKENNTYNEELGGKNLPDSLRVNPFAIPENFFEQQQEQILKQFQLESIITKVNVSEPENATEQNVPEGYFESLSNNIFAKIAERELKEKISDDGFTVPNQYFEELSLNIDSTISENNLKSIVPTLDFNVPDDYFSNTEDQIFSKLAENKLREHIGLESGFAVPENYFDQAQSAIESKIIIKKWPSQLGVNHFSVPVGYFEKLTDKILEKTSNSTKQETSIITLPRRMDWRKYSAAAAIALIIGTTSYLGLQNTDFNSNQISKSDVNFEHLSDEDIISYLAQVSEGEDLIHLVEYVSDANDEAIQLNSEIESDEIEEYLNYML